MRILRAAASACALVALAVSPCLAHAGTDAPPTFAAVKAAGSSSNAVLLDRHGVPLADLRVDPLRRRATWTSLDAMSPQLATLLVSAEDRRFFAHHGVDWSGLAAVAVENLARGLAGRPPRGGSTLTMQLAAMLEHSLGRGGQRSLAQKWDQAQAALRLDAAWSKPEILEAYLNLASFRGDLVGIGSAADALFGKAPSGIDRDEAAILVALLRAPAAAPATVAQRACAVLREGDATTSCERSRALAMTRLGARVPAAQVALAPHMAPRALAGAAAGARVTTTLDADLQRYATASLAEHLGELAGRGVDDGAVVVLDNASGTVLAYVGGSGARSSASAVDGATALRQPGSTLKPFLYALALDRRLVTAASLVDDRPIAIATERGLYAPQDYDHDYRGLVSVRTALASSLNVPAVRTLALVGGDAFLDELRALGLGSLTEDADYYGAALALGSGEVTLIDLANAYRALANGGMAAPVHFLAGAPQAEPVRALGADAAFVIADILADRGARAPTFGLDNALATRVWSAAKTGTSKDMRDNWCVGFTRRYTIGVWVGNFSGAPMHDVSGVAGAAPVWRDLVHYLHRDEIDDPPVAPPGVEAHRVLFARDIEPARREWFLRGTAMDVVQGDGDDGAHAPSVAIRYPADATIIALDPDIPRSRQRAMLSARGVTAAMRWRIDDQVVATGVAEFAWMPTPGRHVVALIDPDDRVRASARFEVRGAALGTPAGPSGERLARMRAP
jgi:penicillin-binding protein 1C